MSSVKVSEAVPGLPARSVSLATSVWEPSVSVGVKLQAPELSAVVVPRVVLPSLIVTVALGSPPPLSAGLEVILSLDELPVSAISASVTDGGRTL